MRLLKFFLAIIIIIVLSLLLFKNQELNPEPIWIWLYPGYETSILLPVLIALTLMAGVAVGFIIALTQIISQKRETMSLRSNVRKLQKELDELRNQSIVDDIVITDSSEKLEL